MIVSHRIFIESLWFSLVKPTEPDDDFIGKF